MKPNSIPAKHSMSKKIGKESKKLPPDVTDIVKHQSGIIFNETRNIPELTDSVNDVLRLLAMRDHQKKSGS